MNAARPRHSDTHNPERLLLTVEEATGMLGIGRSLAYALIAEGELPSITVGRLRRVPVPALHAWVAGRLPGAPEAG